jgi:hypothetical protein
MIGLEDLVADKPAAPAFYGQRPFEVNMLIS